MDRLLIQLSGASLFFLDTRQKIHVYARGLSKDAFCSQPSLMFLDDAEAYG